MNTSPSETLPQIATILYALPKFLVELTINFHLFQKNATPTTAKLQYELFLTDTFTCGQAVS